MLEITVTGFKEIDDALKNLPLKVQKNILVGAVRAASKLVVDSAKQKAPVAKKAHWYYPYIRKGIRRYLGEGSRRRVSAGIREKAKLAERILIQPGLIRRSIRAWKSRSKEASVVFHVGPRSGKGGYATDPWYAIFFESPNSKLYKPFMAPAFDNTQEKQLQTMKEYLLKRISKEFSKTSGGPG